MVTIYTYRENKKKMFKHYDCSVPDGDVVSDFKVLKAWGLHEMIHLYECPIENMQDESFIRQFINELVEFIDMKAYGEPLVARFGEGDLFGYSAVQLIYTSCITMHFSEIDGTIYLDVFSCKDFKPNETARFCSDFFEAKDFEYETIMRK